MICNVVLVSAIQHESIIYIYIVMIYRYDTYIRYIDTYSYIS